ncbi:unnamed protein product [Rhizoctonia solani]|uniref:Uncharacterized protein n=3 Tax=Rhizoctonia solani TaxID=456999 RepID=A0A8H3A0T2_9AGAM|nr:hypothetical protein RSOL_413680 [Rhizoctonia solani AG-3 Rhs1AP]KEP52988.1 hypothetical protein V565_037130 [Rhizoctonia solani 123E]CAE6392491.1 unnamed protein product [Rhizoctonia solani]CAE6508313.1 unnamed protein product [Rhizoctonia solani]
MGGSASKSARKLPTRTQPSWAGARTPQALPEQFRSSKSEVLASETKDSQIESDSKDPHFMSKLSQLGQVQVPNPQLGQRLSPQSDRSLNMIRAREESEQMAASNTMPTNRVLALSLSDLLDARKTAKSTQEIDEIAKSYGVNAQTLQSVSRFVNTPSVDPKNVTRIVGNDGEEKTTMTASWSEPLLDHEHQRIGS